MTIPLQFASLYDGQEVFVWSDCLLDLGTDFLVGNMVFILDTYYLAIASHFHGLHSSLQLCMIHMDTGRWSEKEAHQSYFGTERNAPIVPNWFQVCQYAVVCAIPDSIQGLEPLPVITERRYLKLVNVQNFCLFTLIFVLMPLVLFVTSLVFSTLISMP